MRRSRTLLLVALAMLTLEHLRREAFPALAREPAAVSGKARRLAVLSLCLWAGTILSGRLLAYTHTILLVSDRY